MSDTTEATSMVINMQFKEFVPRHPNIGENSKATGDKLKQEILSLFSCHYVCYSHLLCPVSLLTSEVVAGSIG